jgi:hypothetical protein
MTNHTATTASHIRVGDILHRVKRIPPSRVFEDAINEEVIGVEHVLVEGKPYVRVELEPVAPARAHRLHLDPTRQVWVA